MNELRKETRRMLSKIGSSIDQQRQKVYDCIWAELRKNGVPAAMDVFIRCREIADNEAESPVNRRIAALAEIKLWECLTERAQQEVDDTESES